MNKLFLKQHNDLKKFTIPVHELNKIIFMLVNFVSSFKIISQN